MDKVYGIMVFMTYENHSEPGGYMSVYPTKELAIENAKYNLTQKDCGISKEVFVVELPVVWREARISSV